MSSPTSMKMMPPMYIEPEIRRRNVWWYILLIWICTLPGFTFYYWFFAPRLFHVLHFENIPILPWGIEIFFQQYNPSVLIPGWMFALFAPVVIIFGYLLTLLWTAGVTKLGIMLLNALHTPKPGVFLRSRTDKDYRYWNYRNLMRLFLYWLVHSVPITWGKIFLSYQLFGIKIGKGVQIQQSWIAPEFVSIGNNVIIGQAAGIYSFQFEGDKLLVAPVEIHDNVKIGPQAVILPGSTIHSDIVLEGLGFCYPFTDLQKTGYYTGQPYKWSRNL